jgi:hypothetical protein
MGRRVELWTGQIREEGQRPELVDQFHELGHETLLLLPRPNAGAKSLCSVCLV